jgi:hypothetical protein
MNSEKNAGHIDQDKRDHPGVIDQLNLSLNSTIEVTSSREKLFVGQFVRGPELVQLFDVNDNYKTARCSFVAYSLAKPWHQLSGIDYRNDLRVATQRGLEILSEMNENQVVPTSSVFVGPEKGAVNYIKLALESRSAFPVDNGSIETTYLVAASDRSSARSLLPVINMIAGVVKVKIVNSVEEAVEDMLQSSRSR